MHICYVIWKFGSPSNFQQMGGAENQMLKLTNRLKKNSNTKITIVTKKRPNEMVLEKVSDNFNIIRLNATNIPLLSMILFSISLFFSLLKVNRKEEIDLIHLPLPDLYLAVIYLIRKILKIPIITRIAADELYPFRSVGLWLVDRLFVRSLILRSDGIQALTKLHYVYALKTKFRKEKLFLIPNGIEEQKHIRDYKVITKKIVYIGAMRYNPKKIGIEQKNLEFFLNAFKQATLQMPDLKLIMVGDGNYRKHLENLTRELQLENKVHFTGYQTDINKYLDKADIFVNPSHFEGMPNAVLEAMAKGVLVLCSNIPEHEYIIENNKNGVLFNHKDQTDFVKKIQNFYKKEKEHIKIAKNGREYVLVNHSIDNITKSIVKMYKTVYELFMKNL